ncbi:BlaI/MecI/CopY family transcriptional regulator [Undibacterium sp.]|jgi:BlaI family penicillinase repressor|uniref:BlaI/MecI/CopY family transcriptional regulator n=1 Tax=Undibacterium sp. TaxID=1914977 RepID=UPI00374FFA2A
MDEDTDKVSLSDLQLSIMRVLWEQPHSSAAQVTENLRGSRDLAHTTVATLLTRLEKRGLLRSQREGRQIFYTALMSESQIQRSMLADLLATVFRGNTPALLSHLVQEDEIKADDLEKIRQLIEDKGGDHV